MILTNLEYKTLSVGISKNNVLCYEQVAGSLQGVTGCPVIVLEVAHDVPSYNCADSVERGCLAVSYNNNRHVSCAQVDIILNASLAIDSDIASTIKLDCCANLACSCICYTIACIPVMILTNLEYKTLSVSISKNNVLCYEQVAGSLHSVTG